MKTKQLVNDNKKMSITTKTVKKENVDLFEITDYHIAESLQKEYDRIVGEPDFAAVKAFKFYYPGYSVRKYK